MARPENSMLERATKIEDQLVSWRRDIHMHPELGFEETRTAALVAEELESIGYRVRTGVGRTGVVAERGEGHPIVGIRADMDALPLQETNDVPYASKIPGLMHACGHDAHVAIAMGVATLLVQETFPGTVRFLFQPSEEKADDEGISGAPRMVEDGAMEGVDAVLALHVDADLSAGDIIVDSGVVAAGVDSLSATIIGHGGHGASPHETIDPIYLAAHVVLALHGIVSRRTNPFDPAVITVGSIHAGKAENVIPASAELGLTIRYMEPEMQKLLHAEIVKALSVAKVLGGDFEHEFQLGYPPMVNDVTVTNLLRDVATDLLGAEHIAPPERSMGSEDFGYFSELAPGAMFSLGCKIEGDMRPHHNPRFDVDERCLPIGAAILAEAALRMLRGEARLSSE
jgi:amidohydrolase